MDGKQDRPFRCVPQQPELRKRIWLEAVALTADLPRQRPLGRGELAAAAQNVLQNSGAAAEFTGYAMVMLNNAFWHEQFVATPFASRLLLLPRCLAKLPEVMARAKALSYKIHVADGSPLVLRLLAEEKMDAILGVGCLDSLEKAFQKVQQVGVPAVAIPLNNAGCKETEAEQSLLLFFLQGQGPEAAARTRNYLPLLRQSYQLFGEAEFARLLGEQLREAEPALAMALEFVRGSGKRLRPFATLAGFAACAGASGATIPDGVKRVALAMEVFHKASLIHDDIEDGDDLRYGAQTLHRRFGLGPAINAGDYLVGLGYFLAGKGGTDFGPEAVSQMLDCLGRAHIALTCGQGAELAWSGQAAAALALPAALRRYMQKSSPAFEAALACGLILADAYRPHEKMLRVFCKHLGAAFQIQNDLNGWLADAHRSRPTILLALALEKCSQSESEILLQNPGEETLREIYTRHAVLERARQLAERLRQHALRAAENISCAPLNDLLRFMVETIVQNNE